MTSAIAGLPDMNDTKASFGLPGSPPDGHYRVALRKVYPHNAGQTGDLQAIVEFDIVKIHAQHPTSRAGFDMQTKTSRVREIPTAVVGNRYCQKYTFKYKQTAGEWKAFLVLTAGHPVVNEDVKDWKKYNEEIMGIDNPLDTVEFDVRVESKRTQGGNDMAKFNWSYPSA